MFTRLARRLRRDQTRAERLLWRHLRDRRLAGFKFRRQHPIPPYIVDFVCLERSLVVELDGWHHMNQVEKDAQRTDFLQRQGFRVIRFWNIQVLRQLNPVLKAIYVALESESDDS